MRKLFALLALLCIAPAMAEAPKYDFAAVVSQHIEPRYRALSSATDVLAQTSTAYCAAPSDAGLAAVKSDYAAAFLAWQGIQHVRFGPIKYLSREHRYAMWPDKRGTVGKHLRRLRDDPALQTADFDINQKSVAVQGLSAIERLLYADSALDATGCRILLAIADNLATMSREVLDDWFDGDAAFARYVAAPGVKNPLYVEEAEVAGELLNSLYTELELVETQKLGNPLGSGPQRARGRRAEAWRSELAAPAIRANLEATQSFYQLAFAPALQAIDQDGAIDQRIGSAFEAALASLAQLDQPLATAVATPEGYAQLRQLQKEVSATKRLVTRDMAQTLELPIGFNSLDGD